MPSSNPLKGKIICTNCISKILLLVINVIIFINKNRLTSVIRLAKKNYYSDVFTSNKNNLKKTWNAINKVLGRNNSKDTISSIMHNGNAINNDNDISELFNDYFINVGTHLSESIVSPGDAHFKDYLCDPICNSFFITPTNSFEVMDIW